MPSGRRDAGLADTPAPSVQEVAPDGWYAMAGAALGQIQAAQAAQSRPRPRVPWLSCHPVPILGAIQLAAGAGTLDQPDMYGPKDPYWWDLRRLTLWGWTAGTVTVYLNNPNGTPLATATTPGEFTWSAQHLLTPRDRMVFSATGITGTVEIDGQAIEIETPWLSDYLV